MSAPVGMNVPAESKTVWENWFKPTYDRRIKPLDKYDYMLNGAGVVLSATISFLALNILGIAAFPLALGVSAFILIGTATISTRRVNWIFDAKAWEIVNRMRLAAKGLNENSPAFAPIDQAVGELEKPEFSHQDEQIKELKRQLAHFKKTKDNFANDRDSFVVQLENLQKRLVDGKEIVDSPVI